MNGKDYSFLEMRTRYHGASACELLVTYSKYIKRFGDTHNAKQLKAVFEMANSWEKVHESNEEADKISKEVDEMIRKRFSN